MNFKEISQKFKIENLEKAFLISLDRKTQNDIIQQIQKRLYKKGIDGNSRTLRTDKSHDNKISDFYSGTTVFLKSQKGQPYNRVTLNDSGSFYKSFNFKKRKKEFGVDANFNIGDNHIQSNFIGMYGKKQFENAILKLTDNELQTLLNYLLPKIIQNFKKI